MSDFPWNLTFEVAFDVNPATEPGPTDWTDLTSRVRHGLTVTLGPPDGQARGTSHISLNNRDRALDPTYTGATYNLVPMRHARITVDAGSGHVPLFRGYVKQWSPVWPNAAQGIVQVQLVDAFAFIGLQEANVDLPRQRTHQRVSALLDLAGWPAGLRDVDDGVVWVEPAERDDANLLRMLADTADAEDGELYMSSSGDLTFRSRHGRFDATETVQFGGEGLGVAGVDSEWSTDRITNIGRVQLEDGTRWEFVDTTSRTDYGPRAESYRDLPLRKAESVGVAQWVVYRFAEPHLWLDRLAAYGHVPGQLADLVGLKPGDRVGFEHTPPGPGNVETSGHVETVTHEVTGGAWVTTMEVSPYFGEGPWAQWETAAASSGTTWATAEATEGPRWAP